MHCNDIPDLLSPTFPYLYKINTIILVYMGYPIIFLGIVTSILTIIILVRDKEVYVSTRFMLSCIAITDIWYLTFSFLLGLVILLKEKRSSVYQVIFSNRGMGEFVRNWLLTALALERFLFFYDPLKFQIRWRLSRMRIIVGVLILLAIIFQIPNIAYVTLLFLKGSCEDLKTVRFVQSFLNLITVNILPFIFMAILSILTTKSVTNLMHEIFPGVSIVPPSNVITEGSKKVMQIIRNSLIVFAISSIPIFPTYAVGFYSVYFQKTDLPTFALMTALICVSSLSSIINSACNFFIYIFYIKRYRRILLEIVRPNCLRRRSSDSDQI